VDNYGFVAGGLAFLFADKDKARRAYRTLNDGQFLRMTRNQSAPDKVFETFETDDTRIYAGPHTIRRIDEVDTDDDHDDRPADRPGGA